MFSVKSVRLLHYVQCVNRSFHAVHKSEIYTISESLVSVSLLITYHMRTAARQNASKANPGTLKRPMCFHWHATLLLLYVKDSSPPNTLVCTSPR
jgi:hypothetical protein